MSLRRRSARSFVFWGVTLALGGFAAACGEPDESGTPLAPEQTAESEEAISGGYTDENDKNVVGVVHFDQGAICTGSLLAPNMVLTARHCVGPIYNEADGGGVICSQTTSGNPWSTSGFGVTTLTNMFNGNYSDFYDVAEVVTTPGDNHLCGTDQAILILKTPIPDSEAKPLIPRVDSKLDKNEGYFAVGYGQTSDGNYNSSGVRRRRDDLNVYCAEDDCTGVEAYVKVEEWVGDTGICSGDSGGPAIDLQGRVVGVTSRGGPDCSSPIYGSVHQWGDWIKETAKHAAEVGGYEPAPWVDGFPTDPEYNAPIGGNCQDNGCSICWNDECTRYCGDNAPCPDGYQCEEVQEGTNVCTPIPEPPSDDDGNSDGDGSSDGGDEDDGCSVSNAGADPTNPVPWFVGVGALAFLAARRRRR